MALNLRKTVRTAARGIGFDIRRVSAASEAPFGDGIDEIFEKVNPFTTTGKYRIASVCDAINHVEQNGIAGDFVECGVWKGGSSMAAALALKRLGSTKRKLFLYDTYEGMPEPTAFDVTVSGQRSAASIMARTPKGSANIWRIAQLDTVRQNMDSTGYPADKIALIKGRVQDTIPKQAPDKIAVLRLDTDWYESTKHEIEQLYPRLVPGGVLIVDDYGYWQGSRKAIDEYFSDKERPFFSRIDYTGRIAIKR